ncbi:PIN domain-containing protein [Cellulomonas triticagri]|uniref:PIN domain-containing protein n=1 Tax=Cellulomonas triticagri TaxID=2483352 RepID=UPI0013154137|nr:PIN domain-containing protein [Cellulomonas triticagri]
MRVYADGSALVRYLPEPDFSVDWQRWAEQHQGDLLISSLSLGELRSAALRVPQHVRARAHAAAERLELVRYSDQALGVAAMDTSVLSPFATLHIGVAVAHADVTGFASYDPRVAAVAAIHGLTVVSPGLPPQWWV